MTLASFSVWRASTSPCSGHRAAIDLQFTNVVIFRDAILRLVFAAGAVKIVSYFDLIAAALPWRTALRGAPSKGGVLCSLRGWGNAVPTDQ